MQPGKKVEISWITIVVWFYQQQIKEISAWELDKNYVIEEKI